MNENAANEATSNAGQDQPGAQTLGNTTDIPGDPRPEAALQAVVIARAAQQTAADALAVAQDARGAVSVAHDRLGSLETAVQDAKREVAVLHDRHDVAGRDDTGLVQDIVNFLHHLFPGHANLPGKVTNPNEVASLSD